MVNVNALIELAWYKGIIIITVTFLQFLSQLSQYMKVWCLHLPPHRELRRSCMLYARQLVLCQIQRKMSRCVAFWKHHFLKSSQGAKPFLLAHVCQALPFLIVIWMYFLIQVINSAFERGRETKKLNFCQ